MSGVPDPTSVTAPAAAATVATSTTANGTNSAHPSAMQLFASDPNAEGGDDPLDLDELFHDCYFGEFTVPDDVPSASGSAVASSPSPIPVVPSASAKRTASEAGLTTPTTAAAAPKATAPSAPTPAPIPVPSSLSSSQEFSGGGGGISSKPTASLTQAQKIERRERNREHAKRSRLRKKFLLESLQEQIDGLMGEISTLKGIIKRELPDKAADLLKGLGESDAGDDPAQPKKGTYTPLPMPSGFGPVKTLMEPDYRLMSALSGSQQNFAISDPSLPDNPIVYVSGGFLDLTGYTLDQVLGRNCRFLQGPGTDQAAVDVIRKGVREGTDTSVCLLNYKADGTPFWNQFFVAALRDAENNVVNFVGVQCEVSKAVVEKHISEGKNPASLKGGT